MRVTGRSNGVSSLTAVGPGCGRDSQFLFLAPRKLSQCWQPLALGALGIRAGAGFLVACWPQTSGLSSHVGGEDGRGPLAYS